MSHLLKRAHVIWWSFCSGQLLFLGVCVFFFVLGALLADELEHVEVVEDFGSCVEDLVAGLA